MTGVFIINGHDYAPYIKDKTGFGWSRDNTNDEEAGRDKSDTMHPMVLSHQRTLTMKMGPMPFSVAQQLESDLEGGDEGVTVRYPDLMNGICSRRFYNTSITAAIERFVDDDVMLDDINFTLISIREATV